MTATYKRAIWEALQREIARLGSATQVAKKCDLNPSYISQMRSGNETTVRAEHWAQVARALDVPLTGWQTVETMNSRTVLSVLDMAKGTGTFVAVSNPAGSGKTATCREYRDAHARRAVFYYCVEHPNMGRGEFLRRLAASLGLQVKKGDYPNANGLADIVINYFVQRLGEGPLLIVDEADKLNDTALCFFISLFNAVDGKMGCVILGTENLEKKVRRGVQHHKNGMDELDSRFGRQYVKLPGFVFADCRAVCAANGIEDKALQRKMFEDCGPADELIGGQRVKVLKDLRPLRRKIEMQLLAQPTAAPLTLAADGDEAFKPLDTVPAMQVAARSEKQTPAPKPAEPLLVLKAPPKPMRVAHFKPKPQEEGAAT